MILATPEWLRLTSIVSSSGHGARGSVPRPNQLAKGDRDFRSDADSGADRGVRVWDVFGLVSIIRPINNASGEVKRLFAMMFTLAVQTPISKSLAPVLG